MVCSSDNEKNIIKPEFSQLSGTDVPKFAISRRTSSYFKYMGPPSITSDTRDSIQRGKYFLRYSIRSGQHHRPKISKVQYSTVSGIYLNI